MGNFDPRFADGGARLHFHCIDRAGHAPLEIKLLQERHTGSFVQQVHLYADIEAASVDDFIPQLVALNENTADHATLRFAHGLTRT